MGEARRRKQKDSTFGKVPNPRWQLNKNNLLKGDKDLQYLFDPFPPQDFNRKETKWTLQQFKDILESILEDLPQLLEPPENREGLSDKITVFKQEFDKRNKGNFFSKELILYLSILNSKSTIIKAIKLAEMASEKQPKKYLENLQKDSQDLIINYFFYLVFKDCYSTGMQKYLNLIYGLSAEALMFPEEAFNSNDELLI